MHSLEVGTGLYLEAEEKYTIVKGKHFSSSPKQDRENFQINNCSGHTNYENKCTHRKLEITGQNSEFINCL